MVNQQVRKGGYGLREICVRINSLDTPWGEADLRCIASSGCHAIALPKVERAEQILQVDQILRDCGASPNTVPSHSPINHRKSGVSSKHLEASSTLTKSAAVCLATPASSWAPATSPRSSMCTPDQHSTQHSSSSSSQPRSTTKAAALSHNHS